MEENIVLGVTLKGLIKERKLTLKQVSQGAGIPSSTLSEAINGRMLSAKHLLSLSRFFKKSIEYLLTGSESQPTDLEAMLSEKVFSGYIKVNIERLIPIKSDKNKDGK
jgi:transcriptional regulator with XRE-family HTH domain